MEKSKHDYETEIMVLKQELMETRKQLQECQMLLTNYEKVTEELSRKLRLSKKLVEILLEREMD